MQVLAHESRRDVEQIILFPILAVDGSWLEAIPKEYRFKLVGPIGVRFANMWQPASRGQQLREIDP